MPCVTKSGCRFLAFYSDITRSVDDEIEDNELGIDRRMLSNLHGNAGVDVLEVAFIPIMEHLFSPVRPSGQGSLCEWPL